MRAKEENAIVLDFLKHGYSDDSRPFRSKEPVLQVIGKDHFILMEIVPKEDLHFKPHDEVYIGEGKREQVKFIRGILESSKLTQTAKNELPFIIKELVDAKERHFVEFFNKAGPLTLRSHQLELLPGVGKKQAASILEARENKPFESFADIKARVSSLGDPRKIVIQRILEEIEEHDRFRLFIGA